MTLNCSKKIRTSIMPAAIWLKSQTAWKSYAESHPSCDSPFNSPVITHHNIRHWVQLSRHWDSVNCWNITISKKTMVGGFWFFFLLPVSQLMLNTDLDREILLFGKMEHLRYDSIMRYEAWHFFKCLLKQCTVSRLIQKTVTSVVL